MTAARRVAALAAASCIVVAGSLRAQSPDVGTQAQRDSGKQLYEKYCSQCHGEKGDGEGYAAPHLMPRPRNFTTGKFKVRTTPNGALPTHQDLVNIIKRGMPYTSMPAWPTLSDQQVSDLAHFITTFSPDFSSPENVPKPVSFPSAPSATKESAELGKKLYEETGCVRCHGSLGRGDGPSAPTLKDDWGFPIRAANLSQRWTFRGGSSREDIFKTMSTGFNGTPMPSFADSLTPEQRWAITDFIVSLSAHAEPGYSNLVIAKHVADRIDPAKGVASFAGAAVTRLAVVGQIMEPGRSFHPPATNVTVQAVYDAESIAFLVRWDDMSAEKAGKNSPGLPVPAEEEEAAPAAAAQPSEKDPFADTTAAPAAEASEFSDAVAVQIPSEVPSGAHKPYFIFGDAQHAVDLLFFDLAGAAPTLFTGKGSGAITPKEASDLSGAATYDQGQWSVIFKRPLRPASGAAFTPGEFMPIAFSVWDGYSRERGNRRGLTLWNSVYMEPETVPSAVGPMIRTALAILAIELAVIAWARWRNGKQGRGEIRGQQPVTSG
jgi:mono/diheme cytochrome c family protein